MKHMTRQEFVASIRRSLIYAFLSPLIYGNNKNQSSK